MLPQAPRQACPEPRADSQEPRALRRELRLLRRGRELLALRVKKARRELARTRRRQREAERALLEHEAAVAVLSQRLGCAASWRLPEIDEWRELAREHGAREKELRRQIQEERQAHESRLAALRGALQKGGRPETAKAAEAAESRARRLQVDEHCGRLQLVRDQVQGRLDLRPRELRELLAPGAATATGEGPEGPEEPEELRELVEEALDELRDRHQQGLRDLVQLSNAVITRKDELLKALAYDVLRRGLEDMKLCTPPERGALRELLQDVESICAWRLAGGRSG